MKQILPTLFLFLLGFLFPKNAFSVSSVSIGYIPSSINMDQEFTADVVLTCSGCGTSYLKGVIFYPESSTNYSGYTQNNALEWVDTASSPTSFYKVDSGSWSGQMKFRFDSSKPAGEYFFKVGRFTASGTSFAQVTENISVVIVGTSSTPNPTASSTPTENPNSTQTPSPTPQKAVYKINKPKDQDGQLLTSVKINIDNQYTHHENDEILEFCDGCFCDADKTIPCGYGEHYINLTKSGYSDWSELRNFTQGSNFEITPIFSKIIISTPTPTTTTVITQTQTPTLSKTPTKAPTKIPTQTPTLTNSPTKTLASTTSAVLGESTASATLSALFHEISPTPTPESKIIKPENHKTPFFVGILLAIGSGSLLYFRHRKD